LSPPFFEGLLLVDAIMPQGASSGKLRNFRKTESGGRATANSG